MFQYIFSGKYQISQQNLITLKENCTSRFSAFPWDGRVEYSNKNSGYDINNVFFEIQVWKMEDIRIANCL